MMKEIKNISEVLDLTETVDVVIFDLDDTLYSEKEYVRSGYRAIAREFSSIEDMENKLWSAFLNKEPAIDTVLKSEKLFSEENLQSCVNLYRNHAPEIHLYEGVKEVLTSIKCNGKKLAMITDGRIEGQRNKIRALGMEEIFDKIIITDELGGVEYRKPCPLAFQIIQSTFGADYNRMIYIGDNLRKDFIAPTRLGMQYAWFCNPDGLYYPSIR